MKSLFRFNLIPLKNRRRKLRADSTEAEKVLWKAIRNKKLGVRFVRQFSIDGYVMDFYCPKLRLGIELEGEIHKYTKEYDNYRIKYLEAFSVKILRFANEDVLYSLDTTLSKITPLLVQERGKG